MADMRVSTLFGTTLRDTPAEADIASHGLLLRAGYVRQLAAGIFSYLPLAWRSLRKIEAILREEMEAIGAQEIAMPVVHPADPWKRTGRWQAIDASLVRFRDRGERDMVLAMTHELGTRYSEALGATFTDEAGEERPIVMGSYGIGVGRLLACVAEEHRDERGLALPIAVAPFEVALVGLGRSEEARDRAEAVYRAMREAGVEVLYDDRDASPGVKFADADLRGMPLRVTVSDRSLAEGGVELKRRTAGEPILVPLDSCVTAVRAEVEELRTLVTRSDGARILHPVREAGSPLMMEPRLPGVRISAPVTQ
jgi:prolyl-tRNA synthetase